MTNSRSTALMGMTLIELLVALTIFGVVIATSVAFVARENAAFQKATTRLVALRNLRYAITTIDQDLETLGTNVPATQPAFMYGSHDAVAFSSDYATNISGDPFAVYYDPDAPSGQVSAPGGPVSIPIGGQTPDTVYQTSSGTRSPAEILVLYMAPDSTTARTDDYILYRKVNDGEPQVIARNLLHSGSDPFFSYERFGTDSTGQEALMVVPDSMIPIVHSAKIHLSAADTGTSALADSVRAVLIRLVATNGLTGTRERQVHLSRLVPLINAGFDQMATCGSAPILGVTLGASVATLGTGKPVVNLSWNQATDEAGGEKDVVRYVLWRRTVGATSWGDPFVAIPAGLPSYSYQDATVSPGASYEYALAAQDCSPSLSTRTASPAVTIP